MSIAIRPSKRLTPSPITQADDKTARATAPASIHRPRPAEAPDAGHARAEAAEGWSSYRESPEASTGRVSVAENHFHHGRSRS